MVLPCVTLALFIQHLSMLPTGSACPTIGFIHSCDRVWYSARHLASKEQTFAFNQFYPLIF